MIAKSDTPDGMRDRGHGKNGNGRVTRCIAFEKVAFADLQELAWAANVPVDELVRQAVERYRSAPALRT